MVWQAPHQGNPEDQALGHSDQDDHAPHQGNPEDQALKHDDQASDQGDPEDQAYGQDGQTLKQDDPVEQEMQTQRTLTPTLELRRSKRRRKPPDKLNL